MLLGVDFLYGVAISASIGVLLVMLASLTLLPALLTIAGARVARPGRRARAAKRARRSPAAGAEAHAGRRRAEPPPREHQRHGDARPDAGGAWLRWSAFVQRRPWTIAIASALVMLADRRARDRAAARLQRRLQRPREPDHPPRLRAARAGLRRRLQRPLLVVAKVPRERDASGGQESLAIANVGPATPAAAVERLHARSPPRPASRRSRRRSSTPPAKWRRSPSIRAPPRRPTRPPSSSRTCATTSSRRSRRAPA